MNMLEDKDRDGEDGDEYSGDDEQDPRMPRRRGKYVRVSLDLGIRIPNLVFLKFQEKDSSSVL